MDCATRLLKGSDKHFVFSTMLRGLYHGNDFYSEIEQDAFYANYSVVVERLLATATVKVATLPDDTDVILAYVIVSPGVLHYAFTKAAFRRRGLINKLLAGTEITTVTHLTHSVNPLRILKQLKFNPFLLP